MGGIRCQRLLRGRSRLRRFAYQYEDAHQSDQAQWVIAWHTTFLVRNHVVLKKKICTGLLHPEVRALTFLYSLFDRKDTLLYAFWYSFCILKLNAFNERHFFKYLDDRFPYPFVDFDSLNPYPFIYMKRHHFNFLLQVLLFHCAGTWNSDFDVIPLLYVFSNIRLAQSFKTGLEWWNWYWKL